MKYLFVACLLCLSVLSAVAKVPAMNNSADEQLGISER